MSTVTIDGKVVDANVAIQTNAVIPVKQYTITVDTIILPAGGSVAPASLVVNEGGTAVFNVTLKAGYTVSVSEGTLSGSVWTIPNVISSHGVTITFVAVAPPTWKKIADEGQTFSVVGTKSVRFGKGSIWVEKVVTGSGQCTNAFFGKDPVSGVIKECQVLSSDPVPPTPPVPAIKTLRYKRTLGGVNFGEQGAIAAGETKQFYINLPDELILINTTTIHRDALIKGTNFNEFEINIVDRNNAATFTATITNPRGEVFPIPASGGLNYIKFQNTKPAYPGRYLLIFSAAFQAGITQSSFEVSWGTRPGCFENELSD